MCRHVTHWKTRKGIRLAGGIQCVFTEYQLCAGHFQCWDILTTDRSICSRKFEVGKKGKFRGKSNVEERVDGQLCFCLLLCQDNQVSLHFLEFYVNKYNMYFYDVFPLSIIILRFIHVMSINIPFFSTAEQYFIIWIYHNFSIHSSVERHLDFFQFHYK